MATLKPFRDYDEKDVINLFALDVTGLAMATWDARVSHGAVVKIGGTGGWNTGQELEMLGDAGDASASLANVTSQRYGVTAKIALTSAGDVPLGITLFSVAKYDENGELLKFNPRKASELQVCIEGQAVPVVTRGIFLMNGIVGTLDQTWLNSGGALYAGANGSITSVVGSNAKIGKGLGLASNGNVLVKLEL